MLKAQALPSLSTFVVNFFYSLLNKLFSLFKTIFLDQYTLFLPIDLASYFLFFVEPFTALRINKFNSLFINNRIFLLYVYSTIQNKTIVPPNNTKVQTSNYL